MGNYKPKHKATTRQHIGSDEATTKVMTKVMTK
jgi:hypothetical protein